jgi:hypothetical protein
VVSDDRIGATSGVEQFRGDRPAIAWDSSPKVEVGEDLAGEIHFRFTTAVPAQAIEVEFAQSLDDAKVDVVADTTVEHARRIRSRMLLSEWESPSTEVVVVVQHHLRPIPVVRSVRVGHRVVPSSLASQFRAPGLYYFQPADRRVLLCEAPAPLRFSIAALAHQPRAVSLHQPDLRTRLRMIFGGG